MSFEIDIILLIVAFFIALMFTDDFLIAAIIAGLFAIVILPDGEKSDEDNIVVDVQIEQTEIPDKLVVEVTEDNTIEVKPEFISDQVRNSDYVTFNGNEVCRDTGECFVPNWRQHENGTLYACEIDGLQCFLVR